MRGWVFNPHVGGIKIPDRVKKETVERLNNYAAKHYAGKYTRLEIRFRGALCYIDAYKEPSEPSKEFLAALKETREKYLERLRNAAVHLCRIRHFSEDRWSMAFYSYGNNRYEPCYFQNGSFFGTPEEAFDIGAKYLEV